MKKRIKPAVLILGKLPPPYFGPAVATRILLNSRLNRRYTLHHLDTGLNRSTATINRFRVWKIVRLLRVILGLLRRIFRHWPDIVLVPISQSTPGFLKDSLFILLSALSGRRVIVQLRGSNFSNWLRASAPWVRCYVARVLRTSSGVIVLGENLRPIFRGFFPRDRIFVVPNGADYVFPARTGDSSKPKLLYLGNLQPGKGIVDFINALIEIRDLEFTADVAGAWRDPDTKSRCFDIVSRYRLPVLFNPPAGEDAKLYLLSRADIFIFPPRAPEGHPWVIVEALAAGLPIISTNRGAIGQSVIDGENGFLVDGGHPEQIAGRLKMLLLDPGLRERMGRASRALHRASFTEKAMITRMGRCFDAILRDEFDQTQGAFDETAHPDPEKRKIAHPRRTRGSGRQGHGQGAQPLFHDQHGNRGHENPSGPLFLPGQGAVQTRGCPAGSGNGQDARRQHDLQPG